jgi:hypothetical protein
MCDLHHAVTGENACELVIPERRVSEVTGADTSGDVPPTELEAAYYRQNAAPIEVGQTTTPSLRSHRGRFAGWLRPPRSGGRM